ncbi:MAG: hypothetical protein GX442_14895 [Candidatus Riflebacteria bacterium]|nr:hypothetical protein [Candidatus Riflebacteria bacterium]
MTAHHRHAHGERNRPHGFSLLEVLIAFLILVGTVIGIIQVSRQGGYATESFSSEHFTAMFVSQKVLEDINHRVDQNPHYFTDLIHLAGGEKKGVVDGEHPLFSLLENTDNFSQLDPAEDDPIRQESGSVYRQLKHFKVQVSSSFVPGAGGAALPNLLEVTVAVFWKDPDRGVEQVYRVSQFLSGINEDAFADPSQPPPAPFSDAQVAYELWYTVPPAERTSAVTLGEFLAANGGDREVVIAVGQCFAAEEAYVATTASDGSDITALEAEKSRAGADVRARLQAQEKLAELYELKAAGGFQALARVARFVPFLGSRALTRAQMGKYLGVFRTPIAYCMLRGMSLTGRVLLLSKAAETEFRGLLAPGHFEHLPPRKQIPTARRILDQMKLRILMGEEPDKTLDNLKKTIASYQTLFKGRNPAFLDYLSREAQIARSVSTLKAFYGNGNGLAGQAEKVRALPVHFSAAAEKLYPATIDDAVTQAAAASAAPTRAHVVRVPAGSQGGVTTPTEPATTEPATTEPITTDPTTTDPTTSETLTTEPSTTEPSMTEPSTTDLPAMAEPGTTDPTTEPVAP